MHRVVLAGVLTGWALSAGAVVLGGSDAEASYEPIGHFDEGHLTGSSEGITVNYSSGELYVADGFHARVVRYDSHGKLLGAWGWDVIATGPGKAGKDQTEEITVAPVEKGKPVDGEFAFRFDSAETESLKYIETETDKQKAELVETALNKLSSITSREGKVKVEAESGPSGSELYRITYEDGIGDEQQAAILPVNKSLTGTMTLVHEEKGTPAFEDCIVENGDVCREEGASGEGVGEFVDPIRVAVDQTTGDVYVLDRGRQEGNVQVFSSHGQNLVTSFGQKRPSEPLEEHPPEPEKDPEVLRLPAGIAVDSEGRVYIIDEGEFANASNGRESRVAVFKPVAPREFKEYVYEEAIARKCGPVSTSYCKPRQVKLDASGDLYVDNPEKAFEFVPDKSATPECESESYSELEGIDVEPETEEVIVYGRSANTFFWLEKCNNEGKLSKSPARTFKGFNEGGKKETLTPGVAINPSLKYEGDRPPGVLYALGLGSHPQELNAAVIFAPPIVIPPKVVPGSELATQIGTTHTRLQASIKTGGNLTHYVFQYSTEGSTESCSPAHRCAEAPIGEGVLGAGEEDVAATIGGLSPETVYHFRIVGYNNCNAIDLSERCPLEGGVDHEFKTFAPSTGLPDDRAYELVSPPLKPGSGEVLPASPFAANCSECLPGVASERFPMQSTPSGDEMLYEGGPFAVTGDAIDENEYLASRTESGWQTRDLSPVLERSGSGTGYKAFAPDLERGVFAQFGQRLCTEATEGYADLYLLGGECEGQPGLQPLLTEATPHVRAASEFKLTFAGGSEDLSHIFFEANDALTGETAVAPVAQDGGAAANNLYAWQNGELALVNVLPGNKSAPPGAEFGSGLETPGGAPDLAHVVSRDGSRAFWTDGENHHVYVRENGEETRRIKDEGSFLTASADGSEVLLNDGHLYSLEAEAVVADLTQGRGGFLGILGASEDLSRIYFVDTEVLTNEGNGYKDHAQSGQPNLYYWNNGRLEFIGTLDSKDGFNGAALGRSSLTTSDWAASPSDRTAQVTADGAYLAFMSIAKLTHYENGIASGECIQAFSVSCDEVFEYDAETNRLTCVSCNPTGEQPLGSSALSLIYTTNHVSLPQPANLSENGRVFFDSFDTLSPQDGSPGVEKVYEYESFGLGSCHREGGCVYLISSGTSETDSSFVNATPSGSDVFFTTRSQLVPDDQDGLMDLYDAREGGGFSPSSQTRGCSASETCQGSPVPPPTAEAPVSNGVSGGGGNLALPSSSPPPPPLTRAQRLAKALTACHRQRNGRKRVACEARAKKLYGVKKTRAKKAAGTHKRTGKH